MKLLVALTLIASCSISCNSPDKTSGLTNAIDSLFTESFPADEPGGAILLMKKSKVIFSEGYGMADLSTSTKINTQTLFNLGSISKTFVANAILILEAEGKLTVEDPVEKYFPHFKNKAIAHKVKIKHLLTHTSGLPDIRQTRKDSVFYLTAKDAENWHPVTQADSLLFEPGTRYEYSNPAFNGLALIIEQVSGIKWQQFVKQNIFDPAGMSTSTITDGAHPESGVAHGYLKRNGKWLEKDYGEEPTFAAAGNGGVWSSVEELARYEQSLRKATFLSDSMIARSRNVTDWPNWQDAVPPSIGWSWFIGQTKDGLKTVGHTGSQGGFLCNYVTIPEKEILFVILCNSPRDVEGFTSFITEQLTENNWLEFDH